MKATRSAAFGKDASTIGRRFLALSCAVRLAFAAAVLILKK